MVAVSIFTFRGTEAPGERAGLSTSHAEPRCPSAWRQVPLLPGQLTAAGTGNIGTI